MGDTFLDENTLAEGCEYFRLGALAVSPDGQNLAYSTDTNSGEQLHSKSTSLASGQELTPTIENCAGNVVWNAAGDGFAYCLVNDQWRPNKARYRNLASGADTLLYEEHDDAFFVGLGLSQSEQLLFISARDHVTSEVRYVPRENMLAPPTLIGARRANHEYDVDHQGNNGPDQGRLLIRSNRRHANFDLFETPVDSPAETGWAMLLEGSPSHYLMDHVAFADAIVVALRIDGLDQIQIVSDEGVRQVEFPEPAYSLDLGANPSYQTHTLRIAYTSMVTPHTVFDYDWISDRLTTLKVQEIPGGYRADDYISERLEVLARDGVTVPMSLVRHKDTPVNGSAPVYLYG